MCIIQCIFSFFTTVPLVPTFTHITTVYNNSELIRITSQINIMVQRVYLDVLKLSSFCSCICTDCPFYTIYFSMKTEVVYLSIYVPRVEFMYQMPKLVNRCNLHSLISIGLCYHPFLS